MAAKRGTRGVRASLEVEPDELTELLLGLRQRPDSETRRQLETYLQAKQRGLRQTA